jgi:RNA polymerase-interacting CarD/CdnL/TRCF family regulator
VRIRYTLVCTASLASPSRGAHVHLCSEGSAPSDADAAMNLEVGELVVYGSHGPGRVSVATRRDVVVELGEGLVVTLPIERAHKFLRPLASEHEMANVRRTLRAEGQAGNDVWLKRCKATREKVSVGKPIGLAEVVRDGARRAGTTTPGSGGPRLSLSERQLYLKARRLLALEIGLARSLEPSQADDWIAHQLSVPLPERTDSAPLESQVAERLQLKKGRP